MQYSAAQGYFSPEIAQFFRLFAAHPFRMRPQPLMRSVCGHIVQRIAAQSPNCDQAARDFAMPAHPFRTRPQPSDALRARTYRPTHRRPITELRSARARFCHVGSIVSNAPAAINTLGARAYRPTHHQNQRTAISPRAILSAFCGSIVSNAPAAVDALEVRAYRPTHRPNQRTAISPRAILPCRLIWAQRLSCAVLLRLPRPAPRSARPAPRRMRSRPGAD